MLKTKKKAVTTINQTMLIESKAPVFNPRIGSTLAVTAPLVTLTICVNGKIAKANPWAAVGSEVNGKKVPHRKNIGVKNRNEG